MSIMILHFLSAFVGTNKISNLTPVSKTMFLKSFEQEEFFLCSPIRFKKWKVHFIDHMIDSRDLLKIGEAANTIIALIGQYLRRFCDIPLALVALYLIGRVHDVVEEVLGI